jgi:hypothetical protein
MIDTLDARRALPALVRAAQHPLTEEAAYALADALEEIGEDVRARGIRAAAAQGSGVMSLLLCNRHACPRCGAGAGMPHDGDMLAERPPEWAVTGPRRLRHSIAGVLCWEGVTTDMLPPFVPELPTLADLAAI